MLVKNAYQDPLLTNISVKYTNPEQNFLAEKIFPTVNVSKKTGVYFVYDKSNLKAANDERSGVSRANRIDFDMTKASYGPLVEHSLEAAIEDDVMDQADSPAEPRTDATMALTERMLINKEVALATKLSDTAIITQNATLSGTDRWSDYANSDPFNDIQTGKDTIQKNGLMQPNTLVLGYEVWSKLQHHPDLLERVKYSQKAVLTEELLASLIGVQNVWVGKAVKNTAADGAADAMSYIWGKNALLCYVTPRPAIRSVSFGYHLQLKAARQIDRWDDRSVKSEFVRITDYYEGKLVAVEAAYLLKTVIA